MQRMIHVDPPSPRLARSATKTMEATHDESAKRALTISCAVPDFEARSLPHRARMKKGSDPEGARSDQKSRFAKNPAGFFRKCMKLIARPSSMTIAKRPGHG